MLDETVVGVALPTLRDDLAMTQSGAHWVISIYMLVFACGAAAGGRVGDIIGFRRLLLVGAGLFAVGSLLCGFASNGPMLIAARAGQGLGAAATFPMTVAMIMVAFSKEQRGMALGLLVGVSTVFLALGPVTGGYLSEAMSWRWIFWVNVPVVVLAAVIVAVAFPGQPSREVTEPFDGKGFLTLAGGLGLLVLAIMQGPTWGWTSVAIIGAFALGFSLLGAFIAVETHKDAPLIDVDLFKNGAFSAASLIVFTGQYCKIAIVVYGALFFQDKLGMQPLAAGGALLLAVGALPLLSTWVGNISDRTGARRLVLAGLTMATAAMFVIAVASGGDRFAWMAVGLVMWGVGMPFVYSPVMLEMANSVPVKQQGQVGGIAVSFRLMGGTVAAACGSSLLSLSGSFQFVFLSTAVLMLVALGAGFVALKRDAPVSVSEHHHRFRFFSH